MKKYKRWILAGVISSGIVGVGAGAYLGYMVCVKAICASTAAAVGAIVGGVGGAAVVATVGCTVGGAATAGVCGVNR